jgi:hypothetical protein
MITPLAIRTIRRASRRTTSTWRGSRSAVAERDGLGARLDPLEVDDRALGLRDDLLGDDEDVAVAEGDDAGRGGERIEEHRVEIVARPDQDEAGRRSRPAPAGRGRWHLLRRHAGSARACTDAFEPAFSLGDEDRQRCRHRGSAGLRGAGSRPEIAAALAWAEAWSRRRLDRRRR